MSIGYILIVIVMAHSPSTAQDSKRDWPAVTMQRFTGAKACQHASEQIQKLAEQPIRVVCVPEAA